MAHPLRAALVVVLFVATTARPALAEQPSQPGPDAMAGWKPPVVKQAQKDRQELKAFLKKMEAAAQKGDLEAAAALIDFPVLMVTDDAKGEAGGESWSREQWIAVMKPFYAHPMPPGSMTMGPPNVILVTDSLALVGSPWTMKMGPRKVSGTSATVLIRKGGEWRAKAYVEGGWGDMMATGAAGAAGTEGAPK